MMLQAAMKDKERIEMCRLKDRTGGYHKYVDSAYIHNPDPMSGHHISGKTDEFSYNLESERFDKDFAVADQKSRAAEFEKKQDKFANLRQERYQREAHRFDQMSQYDNRQAEILNVKVDQYNAGKKNQAGAPFNLLHQQYEQN